MQRVLLTPFPYATGPRGRSVEPAARDSFHRALSSTSLTDQPITPQPPSSPTPVVPLHSSSPSQSQTTRRARFAPDPEPTRASPPASPPTYPPIQRTLSASALNTLVRTVSRTSTPSPPPSPGLHRPRVIKPSSLVSKQLRRLGGHLGLEVDTVDTRPDAARSGAGVFGGLVMSTVSLSRASPFSAISLTFPPSRSPTSSVLRHQRPTPSHPSLPNQATTSRATPHRPPSSSAVASPSTALTEPPPLDLAFCAAGPSTVCSRRPREGILPHLFCS